jgi:hypothetical protein
MRKSLKKLLWKSVPSLLRLQTKYGIQQFENRKKEKSFIHTSVKIPGIFAGQIGAQSHTSTTLKGTFSRDFRPSIFPQSTLLKSLIIKKYFRIWFRFRRDIREYVSTPCNVAYHRVETPRFAA